MKRYIALIGGVLAVLASLGGALAFFEEYRPWAKRAHLLIVADRTFGSALEDAKAWQLKLEFALAECQKDPECEPTRESILKRALREASFDIEDIKEEQQSIK